MFYKFYIGAYQMDDFSEEIEYINNRELKQLARNLVDGLPANKI